MDRFRYSQIHMGIQVIVTCFATSRSQAEGACLAAFGRFAELDAIMSDYRPSSELMRLCDQAGRGPVPISQELYEVLAYSQEIAHLSDGALDITCGPLVKLWRQARSAGIPPEKHQVEQARALVGFKNLILDKVGMTAELKISGMLLDLGGVAKGYACDKAQTAIQQMGIDSAMVEAGGDIALSGPPPGKAGWMIAILGRNDEPLCLANCSISTSGDTEQHLDFDGARHSHVLDPRTGLCLTDRRQITVVGPNTLISDSLAKVVAVLGPQAAAGIASTYGARSL
jgi:FAD:protein FMN transferase